MTPARDVPSSSLFSLPTLTDFRAGTVRGAPGFYRVGQTHAGKWWLIDADDRAFFSCGVNAVGRGAWPSFDDDAAVDHHGVGGTDSNSSSLEAVKRVGENLRSWHVNTLGPGCAPEIATDGFATTENLGFVKVAPQTTIRLGGALVPDVFDPTWSDACERQAAERCTLHRNEGRLIGYFTDDGLNWAQLAEPGETPRPVRPSLLQICLSLEPSFPAYHAAWEFTLAAHGGDWAALVRAWDVDLPNKEALRQLTLVDSPLTSPGYRRDQEFFSREFARRYFAVSADAIRRHDPHHLILGCRLGVPLPAAIVAECVVPHVDVLSISPRDPGFLEHIDTAARVQNLPVFLADFSWASDALIASTRAGEPPGLTSVERMLARGRARMEWALAHPALVGCAWARWSDSPGDRPPFGRGLVHIDGREALEHTELLSDLYSRAGRLRLATATAAQP